MAPHAVEVSANVNTTMNEASAPEDEDLTPEQMDEELKAAIADILAAARCGAVQPGRSKPEMTARPGHPSP